MKPKIEALKDLAKVRRRLITIEKRTIVTDQGEQQELWEFFGSYKAERTQLYGQDYYAAAAQGEEQTVVFTVRYLPSLEQVNSNDYRLKYDGQAYDIKHLDHLQDGGLWTKIKAIARPAEADPGLRLVDHELVQALKALVEAMLDDIEDDDLREHYQDALAETLGAY